MSSLRLAATAALAGALLAVVLGSAQARPAVAAPFEGTWDYGTGQVLVTQPSAGTFVGTITKIATFSSGCPHPVGEVIWHATGGGTHYVGTHFGFGTGGCSDRVTFPAVWDVSEETGQWTVNLCTTITTANNRVDCSVLNRIKPPAAAVPAATPAKTPSPVGRWRMNGRLYQWVAIKGGFEERSLTAHKLKHGCLVRAGDAVDRYYAQGSALYRVAYRYWHARTGGAGATGANCTTYWKAPEATVKIVTSATALKMSCDNKTAGVCYTYRRVS